jgi:hypothetical protein
MVYLQGGRIMNNLKVLRILILVFGLVTALVHLWLVYNGLIRGRLPYQFLVNGLGFLVLVAAFFLTLSSKDQWRQLVHYLFLAFTGGSILAWVIVNRGRFLIELSIFDKVVEVLLIVALWLHLRLTQKDRVLPPERGQVSSK